ncbi:MAG: archease [Candidatus Hodarchaeales archaeon]
MEPFYFLEDEATADIAFIANGNTLEETYANACNALVEVIVESSSIDLIEEKTHNISAEDLPGLLYDLLDHLLFLFDTEGFLFRDNKVKIDKKKCSIVWKGRGEKFIENKHVIQNHVKAVTFFGMEISETQIKVTLDL